MRIASIATARNRHRIAVVKVRSAIPREVAEVALLVDVAAEPGDANVVLLVGVGGAEVGGLPAMAPVAAASSAGR